MAHSASYIFGWSKSLLYSEFILLLFVKLVQSANILCISPVGSPSHDIWNRAIALELVRNGHNVTYLSPDVKRFSKDQPAFNFTAFEFEGIYDGLHTNFDYMEIMKMDPISYMYIYFEWSDLCCTKAYESDGMAALLNTYPNDFFDLILTDLTIGPCLHPLIEHFKYPPTIGLTAFLMPPYISANFGNHLYPSYLPWYSVNYSSDMSLMQRCINFILTYMDVIFRNIYHNRNQLKIAQKYMKNISNTNWLSLEKHISLVLTNTDPILNYAQPLPPNIIPVGGVNIYNSANSQEIPVNLEVIIRRAKKIILFTLGTNIEWSGVGRDKIEAFLEAFRSLPKTTVVLWKCEQPDLIVADSVKVPENIQVRKWLPQKAILKLNNTVLFISHCGALSTFEAIFHAVPIVGVPFLVDQYNNIRRIVQRKLGVEMNYHQISADYVTSKINTVLNDSSFYKNMRLASERYKDQPQTPMDRAIFWINYALRHNGTHFLNTPGRNMDFYQLNSVDVIAVLLMLLFLSVYAIIRLFIFQYRCFKSLFAQNKMKKH